MSRTWTTTDPDKVTNFARTPAEHQEFLMFGAAVAGKDARFTSKQLGRAWSSLRYQETKRRTQARMRAEPHIHPRQHFERAAAEVKQLSPYELVRSARNLEGTLHRAGATPHTLRAKTFRALAQRDLAPEKADFETLASVPGVGSKTAKFYLTHSRAGERHAVLDTHLLGWMRDHGVRAPRHTPGSPTQYRKLEQQYLALADKHVGPGTSCPHCPHAGAAAHADFDLNVWRDRSQRRPRQWRGKTYKADQRWAQEAVRSVIRGTLITEVVEALLS